MPSTGRAAHRPSRRGAVLAAAFELAAERPYEEVTVWDLSVRAGMTPAAIYYHFPSKEAVLLSALREFGAEFVEEVGTQLAQARSAEELAELPVALLRWLDTRRSEALVLFVASRGLNPAVETWRAELHAELIAEFSAAIRRTRRRLQAGRATVLAAAYLSLVENAARSWLSGDVVLRRLGSKKFRGEIVESARRLLSA